MIERPLDRPTLSSSALSNRPGGLGVSRRPFRFIATRLLAFGVIATVALAPMAPAPSRDLSPRLASAQGDGDRIFLPYAGGSLSRGVDFEVDHFGGSIWGMSVRRTSVYVGYGPYLVRFDRSLPEPGPPTLVHLFKDLRILMVDIGGRLLVRGEGEMALFDVDRPGEERLLWTVSEGDGVDLEFIRGECHESRDRILLCWRANVLKAFTVTDAGVLSHGSYEMHLGAHRYSVEWIDAERLVISRSCDESACSAGVDIVDISDPENLHEALSVHRDEWLWRSPVIVNDHWLFVGDRIDESAGGTAVLAIHDLTGSTDAAHFPVGDWAISDLDVFDDQVYALMDDGRLQIIDIADPTRPRITARTPVCSELQFLSLIIGREGKHLFTQCLDTVYALDVSNSKEPRPVAQWRPKSEIYAPHWRWHPADLTDGAIALHTGSTATLLNVSVPSAPRVEVLYGALQPSSLASAGHGRLWESGLFGDTLNLIDRPTTWGRGRVVLDYNSGWRSGSQLVPIEGGVVAIGRDSVAILDAFEGERMALRGMSPLEPPGGYNNGQERDGDLVWMKRSANILAIDVSDRSNPRQLGRLIVPVANRGTTSIAAGHGRVYVGGGDADIISYEASDFDRANDLGLIDYPSHTWLGRHGLPITYGPYVIIVDGEQLEIVDPGDGDEPTTISRARIPFDPLVDPLFCGSPFGASHAIADDILFGLCGGYVTAVDLRDPRHPEPLGSFYVSPFGRLFADGNLMWIAAEYHGLYRIRGHRR